MLNACIFEATFSLFAHVMPIVLSPSFSSWSCQRNHMVILSSCLVFTCIYCVYHSDYILRMEHMNAVYIKMYMKVYVC